MTKFKIGRLYRGVSGTVIRYTGRMQGMAGTSTVIYCPFDTTRNGSRWDALNTKYYEEITEEEATMYIMLSDKGPYAS